MGYKTLYDALPFLKDIDKKRQEQFKEYFKTAPLWVMDSFHIEEMDKGVIFVRENAPVENIYFIGKGIIEAIDYRVYGVAYEFMRFNNVYAMGGMEYIMDMKTYRTTLRTVTRCTVVKMSRANFEKWMSADIHALKQEATIFLRREEKGGLYYFFKGRTDFLCFSWNDLSVTQKMVFCRSEVDSRDYLTQQDFA